MAVKIIVHKQCLFRISSVLRQPRRMCYGDSGFAFEYVYACMPEEGKGGTRVIRTVHNSGFGISTD